LPENLESGFKLGRVEVRPAENVLLLNGTLAHVEPKSMDVLLALAGAGQDLVSREDLITQVWPRGFVSDDVLTRCISQLRTALGDNPKSPEFIITIPRKGYRLAQAVESAKSTQVQEGAIVLPFQNIAAGGSDDYVADGLTELLIARLSVVIEQPVISRTTAMTFKNTDRDLASISRQLGVRWVIEGSVMQQGDRMQIVVQLIDASTDAHVWAETWSRPTEDLLTVLNEISRLIAVQISAELKDGEQVEAPPATLPIDLLRCYLQGMYLNSRRTHESLNQAIGFFETVLEARPDHAPALSGLAMSYVLLAHYGAVPTEKGFMLGKKYAQAALDSNPAQADAMIHLAAVSFHYDWDFNRARDLVQEGLALNPNLEMALILAGSIHLLNHEFEKAVSCVDRAMEIDPLNIGLLMNAGDHLILQHRFGEAIQALKAALAIEPQFRPACLRLSMAYAFNCQAEEATACLASAGNMGGKDALYFEYLAITESRAGNTAEAHNAAVKLQKLANESGRVLSWSLARAWASAGEPERAIGNLQVAFDSRSSSMPFLGATPALDSVRDLPEVQALMRKAGLP
jgi:TolB-like protein/tetratricopeptide (TPR) repeat protein